ncbi:DUF883 family protein [Diaphorobacter aerolatus]|uniref:DUF883 family protein n=1 Tax=Diaphorobacter aerolatus TaxID=1288495 RepID=UPI0021F746D1|nr:DUF883 family protein [Diaphorobacter aerolatus]
MNDLSGLLSSKDLDNVPKIADLRARLDSRLTDARDALVDISDQAAQRTREVAKAADTYAHEEPWRVVTGAVAAGVLIGYCLSRR